ncbi:glycosyltransferase [Lactobacillaceae bacterium 24-114]
MKKGIILVPFMTGKGGTESVIHNLFQSINGNDQLQITVHSIGGSENYEWTNGVPISITHISNKRKIRNIYYALFLFFKIRHIIKKEKPDFIISTNPIMWYLSKKIVNSQKLRIPIIAWYHYSLKQKPLKKVFFNADGYLAISSGIKKQLESNGVDSSKIFLIFNPVASNYQPIPRPSTGTDFIYLGRVDYDGQKNLQELIHACYKLKGNWHLNIYGDSSKAKPIKELIHKLNLENHITWKGFVNDPWNNIKSASALVLTSKYEGLPMVLCEAISHGIFCISSDIDTGPIDIITEKNGYLYKSGNVKQLHELLQKTISHSDDFPVQNDIIETSKKFGLNNYGNIFIKAVLSIVNKYN